MALDGGADGLRVLARIPNIANNRLMPGGLVVTEIGHDQGEAVVSMFRKAGLVQIELLNDYNRMNRVVKGKMTPLDSS